LTELTFPTRVDAALEGAQGLLLLAPARRWKDGWARRALGNVPWRALVDLACTGVEPGRRGRSVGTLNPGSGPTRIVVGSLPDVVSRHNSPSRADAVAAMAQSADVGEGRACVIACVEAPEHALPLALAVARGRPSFTMMTDPSRKRPARSLAFLAVDAEGRPVPLSPAARGVVARMRWAASLVDTPPQMMDTALFEQAVRREAKGMAGVRVTSIVGDALLARRLGGIHAVGRAAAVPPRLQLVEYAPRGARRRIGLVGKGVVYDTGGLALKGREHLVSMKCDMAGAAAVAAAALSLAAARHADAVVAALPLAENAIGPDSYRNDDILTMHSGKTVEINNTDAEGRLLLADGVSFLARERDVDVVIDAATLTGAQSIATGIRHAAVVSNREGLEELAIRAGRESGDLTFPLPFAPELFQDEFRSKVADMKNSVANRANAQSSCAAQFVYAHVEDLDVPWLHVDLAGPAFRDERATGFGVGLLTAVARGITADVLEA
jgi:probable aminopeptidase NPEPL1